MNRLSVLCLCLGISGCSSMSIHPPGSFQKDSGHTPTVAVIGDPLVSSWGAADIRQQNPLWTFYGSPAGKSETSGQVLARMPGILAASQPDVVVILVGTFDMTSDPDWIPPCSGANNTDPATTQTCESIFGMLNLAHGAGAKALLCTLPITLAESPLGTNQLNGNEYGFNENLFRVKGLGTPPNVFSEDGIIDIASAVEGTSWTDDGLLFNASGAQSATSAAQAVIARLHVGGLK
jgi:hypothetical protein